MSLKQRFAKDALIFAEQGKKNPTDTFVFTGMVAAVLFGGASYFISEFAPASHDLDSHPQSPAAVETYTTALENLAALRGTPDSDALLSGLLPNADIATETDDNAKTAEEIKVLTEKFATALLIDTRLTEADTQDLVAQFQSSIGDFTDYTGYKHPDYGDLDIARSQPAGSTAEETARNIVEDTYSKDGAEHVPNLIAGMILGGTAPILYFLALSLLGTTRLNDWKNGVTSEQRRKNPKYKH